MTTLEYHEATNSFTVTLDDGDGSEVFAGRLSVCPDPACDCLSADFELHAPAAGDAAPDWSGPYIAFWIDLEKRAVDKHDRQSGAREIDYARRFVAGLSPAGWDLLWREFMMQKVWLSEAADIDAASLKFPMKLIESEGGLVGFHEIFPFGAGFVLNLNDAELVIEESYCLKTGCACADVVLACIEQKNRTARPKVILDGIFVDYKTKKWDFTETITRGSLEKEAFRTALLRQYPDLYKRLRARHKRLKSLYQRFKESAGAAKLPQVTAAPAVSRNAPCPCGSGKKYKRCCGK